MSPHRARLLIAEDSPLQRTRVAALLRRGGHEVVEATDGRMALDLCRIVRPDLLVLDLQLPRLSGLEVLARIRADRLIGALPVVVMTADERAATLTAAFDTGATDFVTKPGRPGEILARVARSLRDKSAVDLLVERNLILREAAEIDALTGLPNRRAASAVLAAAAAGAGRFATALTVVIVDIDHFKAVNDNHGHAAGDQVLRAVAGRLSDRIRGADFVGRWGGEEFLAVLPNTGPEGAAVIAEALRETAAREPVRVGGQAIAVTISVGWACGTGGPRAIDGDALLEAADGALYAAKRAGRNCVRSAREDPEPARASRSA